MVFKSSWFFLCLFNFFFHAAISAQEENGLAELNSTSKKEFIEVVSPPATSSSSLVNLEKLQEPISDNDSSDQVTSQNVTVKDPVKVGKHLNEGMDVMSMIFSLLVVLVIIIFSALLLKRFQGGKALSQDLKLVTSLHLGTKEKVVVIQSGDQQWLLGVTSQQINVLAELDEPIKMVDSEQVPLPNSITSLLKRSSLNK